MSKTSHIVIVELTYTTDDLSKIDALLDSHMAFIDRQYEAGLFLASGPKVPRVGGVILATTDNRDALKAVMEQDPFYVEGVADYTYTTFIARRTDATAFAAL